MVTEKQTFKIIIIIAITALLIGIIIGHYVWTDSDDTKPLTNEQMKMRTEFMDTVRELMQDIMRQYDEAVEWNRQAREEGEKARLKQGGVK